MNSKILTWVGVLTMLLLSAAAIKSFVTKDPVNTNSERVTEIHVDSAMHYRDEINHWHVRAMVAEGNLASLREYNHTLVDSVVATLKLHESQLQYLTALSVEARGRVITKIDTGTKEGVRYSRISGTDGFLTLSGDLVQNFADYVYADSLTLAGYWKRRAFFKGGIWGKKDLYVDAWFQNPSAKIKYINALQVKGSQPGRWGVGPAVGFGYAGSKWVPFIGFSFSYSLIRF